MTLVEVAKLADTSNSYLSQIENGRRNPPKPNMIKQIAMALSDNEDNAHYLHEELLKKANYLPDITGVHLVSDENREQFNRSHDNVEKIFLDKLSSNGDLQNVLLTTLKAINEKNITIEEQKLLIDSLEQRISLMKKMENIKNLAENYDSQTEENSSFPDVKNLVNMEYDYKSDIELTEQILNLLRSYQYDN